MFKQNIKTITRLLIRAFEKDEENKAWDLYLTKFPSMNKDNYINFDDFLKKTKCKQPKEQQTVNEIREEFNKVKNIHQGRVKNESI